MPVNTANNELDRETYDFKLLSIDSKYCPFNEIKREDGIAIDFICNHGQFFIRILEKLLFESFEFKKNGISVCVKDYKNLYTSDIYGFNKDDSLQN